MNTKAFYILFSLLLATSAGFSQSPDTLRLSLVEAVNMAVNRNLQLQSTQLDEEINAYKIKEIKGSALPQLSGNGTFTDNYARASQLLPGEIFGQPGKTIPVKFGTRYVMGATGQLSQKIFDPLLNVGIKAAKASQGLYQLQTFKSKEDLIYNVVSLYVQLQMQQKQQALVAGNLDRAKQLTQIMQAQFDEGVAKKIDVDQLRVNSTNLSTQLSNTANTIAELQNNLKTLLNIDAEQPVAITEIGTERPTIEQQLFLESNTDINLLDYQIKLQKLNTDNIKAGYLPSLSLNANYGWQGQTEKLFKKDALTGFTSGLYSLQLNIPIFDGFVKRNKIVQSNLAVKQLQLNKQYLTQSVQNQFRTASNNLAQNKRVLNAQEENMKVAEELYNVTKLSYTEGIAPLSELINAENSLKDAQTQYLTAMLQMNLAELDMIQSSGQLSQMIKSTTAIQ